jgi:hypothetical protein
MFRSRCAASLSWLGGDGELQMRRFAWDVQRRLSVRGAVETCGCVDQNESTGRHRVTTMLRLHVHSRYVARIARTEVVGREERRSASAMQHT